MCPVRSVLMGRVAHTETRVFGEPRRKEMAQRARVREILGEHVTGYFDWPCSRSTRNSSLRI